MNWSLWVGSIAGLLTTISFVPQAVKIYKTNDTKAISMWMFIIFTIGISLWLVYGLLLNETPIIITNSVTLVLGVYILVKKVQHIRKGIE